MAYSEVTGVATVAALIDTIVSALTTAGWTIDRNNLAGSNRTATVRAPGGSDYIHLFNTDTDNFRMRVSVGYDGGATPSAQPNVQPHDSITNVLAGTYTRVTIFIDGKEAWIAVEMAAAGEYRHIAFGELQKAGSYAGGTYADGSWRNLTSYRGTYGVSNQHKSALAESEASSSTTTVGPGFLRADVSDDALSNAYHRIGVAATYSESPGGGYAGVAKTGVGQGQVAEAPDVSGYVMSADSNVFSGRSIGHVIKLMIKRTGSPRYWTPAGYVKNTRFVSLWKYSVGQEIIIGPDTWKVFPFYRRSEVTNSGISSPDYGSWILGYAIKKVV